MRREVDLESENPHWNRGLSRCKLRHYTVVTSCHGLFHCKMRVTITAASPAVNKKQINNRGSNTTYSGLYSIFCCTWPLIPLASSHEHLNWLPWMPFYFIINEHWSPVSFTFFILSMVLSFSTVVIYTFYNHVLWIKRWHIFEVGVKLKALSSLNIWVKSVPILVWTDQRTECQQIRTLKLLRWKAYSIFINLVWF